MEIVNIACDEFRKRLMGLSPLHSAKEYAGFEIKFSHEITLYGLSFGGDKQTLAWGGAKQGDTSDGPTVAFKDSSTFKSENPNTERMARDIPLTVEYADGKGHKQRKKVKIADAGKK
jgi:hypothetical protein